MMPPLQRQASECRVFVFGSNLAGRHGRGAADFARCWCGAERGVGEGPTGSAYAIPTKDADLRPLPLVDIEAAIGRFIAYARAHPDVAFTVTRIGSGLAGFCAADIFRALESAPANCRLPYVWERMRDPRSIPRVIIAGSRTFHDARLLEERVTALTHRLGYFEIVCGEARGVDALGAAYGRDHGYPLAHMPADWDRYGRAAGMLRNQQMSWSASHLIAFWDGTSPGTRNMIDTATRDGLAVRVCRWPDPQRAARLGDADVQPAIHGRAGGGNPRGTAECSKLRS